MTLNRFDEIEFDEKEKEVLLQARNIFKKAAILADANDLDAEQFWIQKGLTAIAVLTDY